MNQLSTHAREAKYDQLPETDSPNDNLKGKAPFSGEILLNSELISQQKFELEAQESLPQKGGLWPKIRLFLLNYCEMTEAASAIRKKWIVSLSAFIFSKVALEMMNETEKLIPILFLMSYACLGLQIVEDLVRHCYLKTASSGIQREKLRISMANKSLMIIFILSFNLQYYGTINERLILLAPFLFLLEIVMFLRNPLIPQSQDNDMKIVKRVFCLLQSFLIAIKINNFIDWEWKEVLIFLWIYLITYALYALVAGFFLTAVTLTAIFSLDLETLRFVKSRVLGYIWYISYYGLDVVGLIVLIGVFQKIADSNEDEIIQSGILWAKKLSSFLLIYSTLMFSILKKLNIGDMRLTLQNQAISRRKQTILKTTEENQKKTGLFLMVSPTYFSLLTQKKSENQIEIVFDIKISLQNKEENLCYICENNVFNAILTECGHSGMCCECAIKSIEQKNECMECRKPVKAIYKIENYSGNEGKIIVQASEIVQIIKI